MIVLGRSAVKEGRPYSCRRLELKINIARQINQEHQQRHSFFKLATSYIVIIKKRSVVKCLLLGEFECTVMVVTVIYG